MYLGLILLVYGSLWICVYVSFHVYVGVFSNVHVRNFDGSFPSSCLGSGKYREKDAANINTFVRRNQPARVLTFFLCGRCVVQ